MSYIIFALKWRPQSFDQIIGQPNVVTALKSAVEKGRLANAYLFTGPRGVGKTSSARILAKSLNCAKGPTLSPCQECAQCRDITLGRSLDVIEIDGASNRGIEEIRTLRENVKFSPASGKYKIYIIDEVHMLTTEAFNALLKTLEEPPDFVKFIFATTHAHKVLPTVLSRCQRLDFRRISVLEIIKQLEMIIASEKLGVDKDVVAAIARSSDGSLRDAESILDQVASFSGGKIALKDVVSILGLVEQDVLFAVTDTFVRKDPKAALELLNGIIDEGKDAEVFLQNLIEHIRNVMIAKITKGDAGLIDLPQEICARLLKQSEAMSLEDIFSAFNVLVGAREMIKRLDSMRIPLEIALVRLAYRKGDAIGASVIAGSSVANGSSKPSLPGASGRSVPASRQAQAQIVPPAARVDEKAPAPKTPPEHAISLDAVQEAWKGIVSRLEKIKISVASYLNEGSPVKAEGAVLTIAFPRNLSLHKDALEMRDNRAIVEKAISETMSAGVRVNYVLSEDSPQQLPVREHTTFINSTLDMFDGRILKEE